MKDLAYVNVTHKNNQPRVWLESFALEEAGFSKGTPYSVEVDRSGKVLQLRVNPRGDRKTSGRTSSGVPIIELQNKEVASILEGARRLKVKFSKGLISLLLHPDEKRRIEREARFRHNLNNNKLTSGTICAGIGISTAALSEGIESRSSLKTSVRWMVDMNGRFLKIARTNNPKITPLTTLISGMIEDIEPDALCEVDILNVSLSCTNHSKQGRTKKQLHSPEEDEKAGTGILPVMEILRKSNPVAVCSENVPEAQSSETYTLFRACLRRLGYTVHEWIINGDDVGSLENRTRYWFVAVSEGLPEFKMQVDPSLKIGTKIIADILDPADKTDDLWFSPEAYFAREKANKAAGRNFKTCFVTPDESTMNTIPATYARGQVSTPHLIREDGMIRRFTGNEHARIKQIPEYFIAGLPETVAHYVLGQSILWMHAKIIGVALAVWANAIIKTVAQFPVTRKQPQTVPVTPVEEMQMGLAI